MCPRNTVPYGPKLEATQCLSAVEQINKLWYIHTVKYYKAMRMNTLLVHETIWMSFTDIMLSKESQTQKSVFPVIHSSKIGKTHLWW